MSAFEIFGVAKLALATCAYCTGVFSGSTAFAETAETAIADIEITAAIAIGKNFFISIPRFVNILRIIKDFR